MFFRNIFLDIEGARVMAVICKLGVRLEVPQAVSHRCQQD